MHATADPRDPVRAFYDAFNARDFDAAAARVAPDFMLGVVPTGAVLHGPAGVREWLTLWANAFPDSRIVIDSMHAAAGFVSIELTFTGTQTGSLVSTGFLVPPSQRSVTFRACELWELRDGRPVRLRSYLDALGLAQQLGVVPGNALQLPDRRAPLAIVAIDLESESPEQNRAVVLHYLDELYNRANLGALASFCSQGFIWQGGSQGHAVGPDAPRQALTPLLNGFPDLRLTVEEILASDDLVVTRVRLRGTHRGEYGGRPATGRAVELGGTLIHRVREGKLTEEWWQIDVYGLMQQIGALAGGAPIPPASL